jgi:predicted DNA-binding WGR domain protein
MRHHLINHKTKAFWQIELSEDEVLTIRAGAHGKKASVRVIDDWEEQDDPPEVLFETLTEEQFAKGYVETLPDDLLADVEAGHSVKLTGRALDFYTRHEYKALHHAECGELGCRVDFGSNAVQGNFDQTYVCPETQVQLALIPFAGKLFGDSSTADEQQWIGLDSSKPDGKVFELFTSGEFSEAYPDLDTFLADLRPVLAQA